VPSGACGDFAGDAAWVYENYSRTVIQAPGKPARCDFSRAISPPPFGGSLGLMVWAAENRTAFFKNLLPKALTAAEDVDETVLQSSPAEEEKSLSEIRATLATCNRDVERQLAEDTPATIRETVRGCIGDWQRMMAGVDLPTERMISLERRVSHLADELVAAALATAAGSELAF
jgi:hypothetical protein